MMGGMTVDGCRMRVAGGVVLVAAAVGGVVPAGVAWAAPAGGSVTVVAQRNMDTGPVPVPGVVFAARSVDGVEVEGGATGPDGMVVLRGLGAGVWTVREVSGPGSWRMDPFPVKVVDGEDVTVEPKSLPDGVSPVPSPSSSPSGSVSPAPTMSPSVTVPGMTVTNPHVSQTPGAHPTTSPHRGWGLPHTGAWGRTVVDAATSSSVLWAWLLSAPVMVVFGWWLRRRRHNHSSMV